MKAAARARARRALLAWFREHARDLPWRRTRDPYAIWVSEVMLQQTRVETVLRYYDRFLGRFPTVRALAEASEDDVLARWSGLGYYRRARLLHEGARAVVGRHGGSIPEDASSRRALPGVGRYTAGALGSIAFGLPEPIVDGNVERVLSRLLRIEHPRGSRESQSALWAEATEWAHGDDPGAVNQALMELGATICTASAPRCGQCPVRASCAAKKAGLEGVLPVARPKRPPRAVSVVALVARDRRERVLLTKRAGEGSSGERSAEGLSADALFGGALFAGLWTTPMAEGEGRGVASALAARVGAALTLEPPRELVHVLTHRRLFVRVHSARVLRKPRAARLVALDELDELGIATLTKKILSL